MPPALRRSSPEKRIILKVVPRRIEPIRRIFRLKYNEYRSLTTLVWLMASWTIPALCVQGLVNSAGPRTELKSDHKQRNFAKCSKRLRIGNFA